MGEHSTPGPSGDPVFRGTFCVLHAIRDVVYFSYTCFACRLGRESSGEFLHGGQ